MYKLLAVPKDLDTHTLRQTLWAHRIGHRVTQQDDQQIVWLADPEQRDAAARLIELWHRGELETAAPAKPRRGKGVTGHAFAQAPLTASLIAVCTLIFFAMGALDDAIVRALSIVPLEIVGDRLMAGNLEHTLASGQLWRLVTPVLLHFGWMHIVFNMLWLWYFGRQIEAIQGRRWLAPIVLVAAIGSNLAQYATGTVLFGGMSGVDYALLGYVWLLSRLRPGSGYFVPQMLVVFMLIWMVFTMTDMAGSVGFGNVANEAHLGGLLVGLVIAAIASRCVTDRQR
ncbi:rhomboid family intramembrane serine protease [Salinicola halophilus]|uniref:rhomboid family intramembrane serine protease n=1 Tax=Salinicola halophilus TaxID=184065 RepID=UPI000DA1735A|nr:rhomboid family intramembrane serine protease [Salinicola halophilus]